MRTRRRHLALWAAAALSVEAGWAAGCAPPVEPPAEPSVELPQAENLVLVTIDTLRADHLACYGHPFIRTPHIDRLAAQGVLFSAHVSSAPSTLSAHTSLMTGTHGHTHGVPRNGFEVPEDNLMLAEVLTQEKFVTSAVIGAFPLRRKFLFDQGFATFVEGRPRRDGSEVHEDVRAWLEARRPGRFFLFVHYWDPHYPYDPPPPYDEMYGTIDVDLERTKKEVEEIRASMYEGVDESARSEALKILYAGEVTYVDDHIGNLLALLEEHDVLESSLLVLTADHGEAMDEHWEYWDHGESTYDHSVHTPLILRLPGAALAGTRRDEVVSSIDVMPTVLELLGVPVPRAVEGSSLVPLLASRRPLGPMERPLVFTEATKPHESVFKESTWINSLKCRAVREGRWKLIHRPTEGRFELYDVEADPKEEHDVFGAGGAEQAALVERLIARLEEWSAIVPARTADQDLSEETRRELEKLGYVEGSE